MSKAARSRLIVELANICIVVIRTCPNERWAANDNSSKPEQTARLLQQALVDSDEALGELVIPEVLHDLLASVFTETLAQGGVCA